MRPAESEAESLESIWERRVPVKYKGIHISYDLLFNIRKSNDSTSIGYFYHQFIGKLISLGMYVTEFKNGHLP